MRCRRSAAIFAWTIPVLVGAGVIVGRSGAESSGTHGPAHDAAPIPSTVAQPDPPAAAVTTPVSPSLAPVTAPATTALPDVRLTEVISPPSVEVPDGLDTPPADALVQSAPPVPDPGSSPSLETPATDAPVVAQQMDDFVLDIPSIALSQSVVAGDQTQIDQGMVTAVDWTARGFPASCLPGDGCTIWLAGHRSMHGAVFARLPELAVGATISIQFHGQHYEYAVTSVVVIPGRSTSAIISGDLLLQTSLPEDQRILIYADQV